MTLLSSKRIFSKDISRIRNISSKIDKRLSELKSDGDDNAIEKLSVEELQDLDKIASIADFMLSKYEDKKDMKSLLKYFKSVISDTSESLTELDDDVSELIISAEDSINKVKDMHANLSDKSDFKKMYSSGPDYNERETSGINLTNFAIEINTVEYQQNSQGDNA